MLEINKVAHTRKSKSNEEVRSKWWWGVYEKIKALHCVMVDIPCNRNVVDAVLAGTAANNPATEFHLLAAAGAKH